METIKQQRVASVIKRALSEIFVNEAKEWFGDAMITVTVVRVTADPVSYTHLVLNLVFCFQIF